MAFDTVGFTLTVGLIGSSFLLGIVLRSLGIRGTIKGVGLWSLAMLFVLAVVAFLSAIRPVLEPLWLQYLLLAAVPFGAGYGALALLVRGPHNSDSQ